jgi:hypothetical protein
MRSDQVMKKANQRKPIPICRKGRKKDPSIPSIGQHENTLFVRFVESPSIIASRAPSTRAARKSRSVAANDVSAVLVPVKLRQGPGRWDQRPRKSGPGKSEAQPPGKAETESAREPCLGPAGTVPSEPPEDPGFFGGWGRGAIRAAASQSVAASLKPCCNLRRHGDAIDRAPPKRDCHKAWNGSARQPNLVLRKPFG